MINFIGIGAQKSGTSWVYACLYDHPQICAPIKEIHFFSRPRFAQGKEWYESHFTTCDAAKCIGEFSTSYLYSVEAPERIHAYYPEAKIIAIIRNPVDRAYSQYRNAIKAGEITEMVSFDEYARTELSVLGQGKYAEQLSRYNAYFDAGHMLVLVYEDIAKDPGAFMQRIYSFLGIDTGFVSRMLYAHINVARTPRFIWVDRMMHHIAEFLRRVGFDRVVWFVRLLRIPDIVRMSNTKKQSTETSKDALDYKKLGVYFVDDARLLQKYCGRDMVQEWNLQ